MFLLIQHPNATIAIQAKAAGQLWSKIDPAEKEKYQERAAEERIRVSADIKAMTDAGLMPPPAKDSSKQKGSENELVLPLSRIKKIAKLDPEVRGITKEAMSIMVLAAEMFIKKLGQETNRIAQTQNRRTLLPEDVVDVCSAREAFAFLREDIRDLHREQVEVKKSNRKAVAEAKMKLAVEERTASRPIDSFFKAPP